MVLPGFKASCMTLAGIYVVIAGSLLARGIPASMAQYQVPAELLSSPHYVDAMSWVFQHMLVIGLMIGTVGFYADSARLQRPFSRLMLLATLVYTALDVHTADWPLGNALYKGGQSLAPVVVDVLAVVLWARLSLVRAAPPPNSNADRPSTAT